MVCPFVFEDYEVCLIIQAQATTLQLSKKFLELKVLFCQWKSGPLMYLYLILNLISLMFECEVTVTFRKLIFQLCRGSQAYKRWNFPLMCVGLSQLMSSGAGRFVTIGKLCRSHRNFIKLALLQGLYFWAVMLYIFAFSPSSWKCNKSKRMRWMATTKCRTLGWKAATGKKEGTSLLMSWKKRCFFLPKIPVTVPKIKDHQTHC